MDLKCYLLYLNQLTHKYYVKKPLQNVMDTLANVISKNTSIVFYSNSTNATGYCISMGHLTPTNHPKKLWSSTQQSEFKADYIMKKFLFVYSYETVNNIWNIKSVLQVKSTTVFSGGIT